MPREPTDGDDKPEPKPLSETFDEPESEEDPSIEIEEKGEPPGGGNFA